MRLIDAKAVEKQIKESFKENPVVMGVMLRWIRKQPTAVDAVSRVAHEQVAWERDIAIQQLEEHGIPFGGIATDDIKVVRCKDCKHNVANWVHYQLDDTDYTDIVCDRFMTDGMEPDDFCSYGERKDNGENESE